MPFVRRTGKGIEFRLLTKSKARFSLRSSSPGVVLHADWQEYNRKGDGQLTGFVNSDRTLQYIPLTQSGVALTSATVPFSEAKAEAGLLKLILEKGGLSERKLVFTSVQPLKGIRLEGRFLPGEVSGLSCQLTLPEYQAPATLEIRW
jgi:hypothetical protein